MITLVPLPSCIKIGTFLGNLEVQSWIHGRGLAIVTDSTTATDEAVNVLAGKHFISNIDTVEKKW